MAAPDRHQPIVPGDSSDAPRLVGVLRRLQDLSAEVRGDMGEQLIDVLRLGCRELGVPVGMVLQVSGEEGSILEAVGLDGRLAPGTRVSLAHTYCGSVLEAETPVGFPDDVISIAWPEETELALKSYLGVPLRVGGRVFGVLSFGSETVRAQSFSALEKDIVQVVARHLEGVIGAHLELRNIVTAFNEISRAAPARFFEVLALQAAALLDADYILVCELAEEGEEPRLRTQAYLAHGQLAQPFTYAVRGTPCERTIGEGVYHCSSGLQRAFPDDADLVQLRAESYLGAAITDDRGTVIGQVAALSTTPMEDSRRREQLIRWLAARATPGLARVRAERALVDQGRVLELAVEAGGVGIWDWDLQAERLHLDRNARAVLDLDECDDWLAAWQGSVHPDDQAEVEAAVQRALAETGSVSELVEHRIVRRDNTVRWVLVRGRVVRDSVGRPIRLISAGLDITDRKRLDEERQRLDARMQQSQRLESLGVLAGGLAHDFNNLLMGVLGNAGLARRAVPRGTVIDQKIAEIESAAQRAAELTNQMLAYSGRSRFTADSVDLNALVEEMARLLRTVVSRKAALSLQLSTSPVPIEADAAQIQQVVMNLITNASDALADQPGAVTVVTGRAHFDRAFLADVVPDGELLEGHYAYLEVTDTGIGMDPQTLGRIFDPFFTTKFSGRGLGMAAVLGIMRSHGAGIRVQSAPGEGTRITVLFPAAEVDESLLEAPIDEGPDVWEGQGAVLVVDDEEMVRTLMATVLEDVGFEVLTASDGVEALDIFEKNQDRIRLILLDMMMPRMNGEEVYSEIRAKQPDASIILMSGFSEEHVARSIPGEDAKFLKKPFEIGALLDTVQDVLDS